MFTGIIESAGRVSDVIREKNNITYRVSSKLSNELRIDQSVSHDGVCLTVVKQGDDWHEVTAIYETLLKTNLCSWEKGKIINLERCMLNNGRFDGHIVQGHVDQVGKVKSIKEEGGSWYFGIAYENSDK